MKNLLALMMVAALALSGCQSNTLTKEMALKTITKELNYPRAVDYDIFCGDPNHARRVLDAGLEDEGLVTVARTRRLIDVRKPLIRFTEKAKPYLLPTPKEDQASNIQKVKLAREELKGITDIAVGDDHKHAIVKYSTAYTEITPFSVLTGMDLKNEGSHKAFLLYSDHHWHIVKKPGPEFLIGNYPR